ncbi:hypothetical protein DAMNIGENAA_14710 [Desulforhabdus amnigena]|uniref:Uncharacterized protein n=1 Tax=Desulforhabdus amnigena TaxID=40218 RepID=A0A9W6FSG8_9BACT|nr:hypothetical protein DAMNIGENAA_14710 [Desulforhabdus amnigena]
MPPEYVRMQGRENPPGNSYKRKSGWIKHKDEVSETPELLPRGKRGLGGGLVSAMADTRFLIAALSH